MRHLFIFLLSFAICALGQPAWIGPLSIFAASIGYALFWYSFSKGGISLFQAFIWFFFVELVHLSWMSSIRYQGILMLLVYFLLAVALSLQFIVFSYYLKKKSQHTVTAIFAFASAWTLIEWSRIFFLSGFTWNPLGLSLSWSVYSAQIASFFGVYGLSFYVILTNLFVLKALMQWRKKDFVIASMLAFFPYLFGYGLIQLNEDKKSKITNALLIHTSLSPEEKEPFFDPALFISPLDQWELVLDTLKEYEGDEIDLIVFPEGALPYEAFSPTLSFRAWHHLWTAKFGDRGNEAFLQAIKDPPLRPKFGQVNNALVVQSIANLFQSDVIIGLRDEEGETVYNSAFHFKPNEFNPEKYAKRVLVPVAEYIPFEWCRSIAADYGLYTFFTPGSSAKVFSGKKNVMAVSICYEETYSNIIQEGRRLGAQLFVNITNDIWFPNSKLAKQHYDHGIIRAVENGIPVIRATNHGITGGVDAFGREIQKLPFYDRGGALLLSIPLQQIDTWFSIWGNKGIVVLSLFLLFFHLLLKKVRNKKEVST